MIEQGTTYPFPCLTSLCFLFSECGHINHNDTIVNRTHTVNDTYRPDCPPVYNLRRIENPNVRFSVQYSFGPTHEEILLALLNDAVTLLQFNIAPVKDTGGTLTLKTSLQLISVNLIYSFSLSVICFHNLL